MNRPLKELLVEFLKQDESGALRSYVRASEKSCRRWRENECEPSGYWRMRVMQFLDRQGFPCAELLALPDQVRTLGRLIADGAIGVKEAVKATDAKTADALLDLLLGRRNCTFERLQKIDALVGSQQAEQGSEQKRRGKLVEETAELIKKLQPLTTRLVSNEFTPQERAQVRALVGEMAFFRFSNAVDTLCGGKAVLTGNQPKTTNHAEAP